MSLVVLANLLAPFFNCDTHTRARAHKRTHTGTQAHTHTRTHTDTHTDTHTHTHTHTHRIPSRGMGTFFPHTVSSICRVSPTHTHTHTHTHQLTHIDSILTLFAEISNNYAKEVTRDTSLNSHASPGLLERF